ncbi:CubicO group peptidase (beta-lactamase class C family) [Mesonia hippocampi]|uniref:CubicO group peptidase (Beta-lactamase class C family) n=1 Tax=Mesonia hippocampi TaxID=1628250 RepID=A0A840ERD7_9FLAO|nr:serine hydrolase domain-containing protein [Mesonia hippocampi]MBB4119601.1 CubicO group peptidase (beta-lactamase class C family) [Mesonia hippocampi]
MKKIIILYFFIIGFSHTSLNAQELDTLKLNAYFNTLEANNKFMGSVALSKNGKLLYTKSTGYLSVEDSIAATNHTKYKIGSISKTFTATLILKAAELKKLDLNQPINIYFPELINADKISIKDLLNHRSGIHDFTQDYFYSFWNTKQKTQEDLLEIIINGGNDFAPNTKAQYSNANYILLSIILEKVFKKTYANLLEIYITKPLKLKNTYLLTKEIDIHEQEAKPYNFISNHWEAALQTHYSIPLGAGGVISTPIDLIKFSEALFGGKILKPESLALMQTTKDQFGLGLFLFPYYNQIGFGHTGGIDGYRAVFSYFPDTKVAYVLISNGINYNFNNISLSVLNAISGRAYKIPEFSTATYKTTEAELDKHIGVYASTDISLKITISKTKTGLTAQATGQASFPLKAINENIFTFDQAGIQLTFNPTQNTMLLLQNGKEFLFTKE